MRELKALAFVLLLFFVFATFRIYGQTGLYFVNNYSPSDYHAADQNWSVVQDEFGRLYVANNDGVLLYDGKYWKKIVVPVRALSVARSANGTIYVGGQGDIGLLKTDKRGQIKYQSLKALIGKDSASIGNVWYVRTIDDDVFFCSPEFIFHLKGNKITSLPSAGGQFHTFFHVGKHLFVRERGTGFKVFTNGELKTLPGSEIFAAPENRVDFILPKGEQLFFAGSRQLGLFILNYDGSNVLSSRFTKAHSLCDSWMRDNQLYCGAAANDQFVLGSLNKGILITDKEMKPVKHISISTGLQDESVKNIYTDHSGNLWIALNRGISFIEINTPITKWTSTNGIHGTINTSIIYNGRIYAGTTKGVLVYDTLAEVFIPTEIYGSETWGFSIADNDLLIATDVGLFSIHNGKISLINEYSLYSVFASPHSKDVYLGTENEIIAGTYSAGTFTEKKIIADCSDVKWITEDSKGNIAAGTTQKGIFIVDPETKSVTVNITSAPELPALQESYVFTYEGEIFTSTPKGFYQIKNDNGWRCERAKDFSQLVNWPVSQAKTINGEVWFQSAKLDNNNLRLNELAVLRKANDKYVIEGKMLSRIKGVDTKDFFYTDNKVFISTNNGLFCYDIKQTTSHEPFNILISLIETREDTLLENFYTGQTIAEIKLNYSNNEITIIPAAADFLDQTGMEYSWMLNGKDEKYEPWTPNISHINYNNLHEGSYVFHLKARNILGVEGKPLSFAFEVLSPWYRTWWAFSVYAIIGGGIVWAFVLLNTKRLKLANVKLENIITERTKTIVDQKIMIEHKNQEITDSINYAKRIQLAILPDVKEVTANWPDTFVFYQPKDIVSGDFYWWKKLNNDEFYIAVADCTGHGVPGGFMCMICSDKLHEGAKLYSSPEKILFHANNAIKETLKQGDGSNKDGMEIAMLRINTKTKSIAFSGANRFLWVVKNTGELTEIKGTKASIASTTEFNFQYSVHSFDLNAGDQLYLSSDGFPDQFGGPEGKKFMSKNFKEFIMSIRHLPVSQQGEQVKNKINQWMEGYEQVDDLLVIGVKL